MGPLAYLYTVSIVLSFFFVGSFACSLTVARKELKREINKQDVNLSEMREIERIVSNFLNTNKIDEGEEIYKIANKLKIRMGGYSREVRGGAHLSEKDSDGFTEVTFARGMSAKERRFHLAHECAHLIHGDALPADRPNHINKGQIEQRADYTAAALLMPYRGVLSIINDTMESRGGSSYIDKKVINKICKTYKVSRLQAIRRIKEVNEIYNSN